jgi:hypothetical protein
MTATTATAPYRLDPDLSVVVVVLDGVTISNGLDWSPDGSRAYYTDTETYRIDVFNYDAAAGLTRRRRFAEIPSDVGRPDGLTVDAQGGVWVAVKRGGTVRRYTSDGHPDEVIEVRPARSPPAPLAAWASTSCSWPRLGKASQRTTIRWPGHCFDWAPACEANLSGSSRGRAHRDRPVPYRQR